jgi:hypothetical protein
MTRDAPAAATRVSSAAFRVAATNERDPFHSRPCHLFTMSPLPRVIPSPCHPVTPLSPFYPVTPSPCHRCLAAFACRLSFPNKPAGIAPDQAELRHLKSNLGTRGAELRFHPLNMRVFKGFCQNVTAISEPKTELRHL